MAGAGQVALLPLGRLADVDDRRRAGGQGVDLLGGDFSDLRAGLAEEVGVGLWHGMWDSGVRRAGAGRAPGRWGFRGRAPRPMASRRQAGGRHLQRRSIAVVARGDGPVMRSSRRGRRRPGR